MRHHSKFGNRRQPLGTNSLFEVTKKVENFKSGRRRRGEAALFNFFFLVSEQNGLKQPTFLWDGSATSDQLCKPATSRGLYADCRPWKKNRTVFSFFQTVLLLKALLNFLRLLVLNTGSSRVKNLFSFVQHFTLFTGYCPKQ